MRGTFLFERLVWQLSTVPIVSFQKKRAPLIILSRRTHKHPVITIRSPQNLPNMLTSHTQSKTVSRLCFCRSLTITPPYSRKLQQYEVFNWLIIEHMDCYRKHSDLCFNNIKFNWIYSPATFCIRLSYWI